MITKALKSYWSSKLNDKVRYDKNSLIVLENNSISERSSKYEVSTNNYFNLRKSIPLNYAVDYITDLHLDYTLAKSRNKSLKYENEFLDRVVSSLKEEQIMILIGGDISGDFRLYQRFIEKYKSYRKINTIFLLGNHEFWPFKGKSVNEINKIYENIISSEYTYLLQNGIIYIDGIDNSVNIIKEEVLLDLSIEEIKNKTKTALFVGFGGTGFAEYNNEFNASNNIYLDVISREEELKEGRKFYFIYKKICKALNEKRVVIFTHMPFKDWAPHDELPIENFIYISGHTHKNISFTYTAIFRQDNQIGYNTSNSLKYITKLIRCGNYYDIFSNYGDGIYEITHKQYADFYCGIENHYCYSKGIKNQIYFLKKKSFYLFLSKSSSGEFMVLNRGNKRKIKKAPLEYFYNNMDQYALLIKKVLKPYTDYQKEVANFVKSFGGYGTIHGCIIDISIWSHIYVNPYDKKLTCYFAYSMVDKKVYSNLYNLLKDKEPRYFANYQRLISGGNLPLPKEFILNESKEISKPITYLETDIYKASRIIRALQGIDEINVIKYFNDDLLNDKSIESIEGVLSLIDYKEN